jgi:F-type H+-transporting ATPase subunit delta
VEELAQVYSRALFDVALEHDKLDVIRDQLAEFVDALNESNDLRVFLFSPYFSAQEKKEGLTKALTGADANFVNFLELLIDKHRTPVLFRIRAAFQALYDEHNKLLPVTVTSAIELDKKTVKDLGDRVGEQTGRKVELTSEIDPSILGGIVLRVGNSILDASIRNRLQQLRREVAKA